jgi:hypothetical protein
VVRRTGRTAGREGSARNGLRWGAREGSRVVGWVRVSGFRASGNYWQLVPRFLGEQDMTKNNKDKNTVKKGLGWVGEG